MTELVICVINFPYFRRGVGGGDWRGREREEQIGYDKTIKWNFYLCSSTWHHVVCHISVGSSHDILGCKYHFLFRMSRLHLTMIAPATVYFPIIYTSNRVFPPPHNQLPRTLYPWRTTFTTAWRWGCNFKGQNRHL